MFQKEGKIKRALGKEPCEICGRLGEADHIRTRKSGGDDRKSNVQFLCRPHHAERHAIGIKSFTEKYKRPIDCTGIYPIRTDQ